MIRVDSSSSVHFLSFISHFGEKKKKKKTNKVFTMGPIMGPSRSGTLGIGST